MQRLNEILYKFELPKNYKYLGRILIEVGDGKSIPTFSYSFEIDGANGKTTMLLHIVPDVYPYENGLDVDFTIHFEDMSSTESDVSNNQNIPFKTMKYIGALIKKFIFEDAYKELLSFMLPNGNIPYDWEFFRVNSIYFSGAEEKGDAGRRRINMYKDMYRSLITYLGFTCEEEEAGSEFAVYLHPPVLIYQDGVVEQVDIDVEEFDFEDDSENLEEQVEAMKRKELNTKSQETYIEQYLRESKMR